MSTDALTARTDTVLADLVPGAWIRDVALIGGYAALIGASAQLGFQLWFTPVPITGQTFAVLLGAIVLGTWRGAAGAGLYLAAGLVGLPWFAAASGASLGYIIGFVPAAALVGWLAQRGWDRTPLRMVGAMVLGNLAIYAVGVPYLGVVLDVGLLEAIGLGATPFIIGDLIKIVIATALVPATWKLVGQSGQQPQ